MYLTGSIDIVWHSPTSSSIQRSTLQLSCRKDHFITLNKNTEQGTLNFIHEYLMNYKSYEHYFYVNKAFIKELSLSCSRLENIFRQLSLSLSSSSSPSSFWSSTVFRSFFSIFSLAEI